VVRDWEYHTHPSEQLNVSSTIIATEDITVGTPNIPVVLSVGVTTDGLGTTGFCSMAVDDCVTSPQQDSSTSSSVVYSILTDVTESTQFNIVNVECPPVLVFKHVEDGTLPCDKQC